MKTAARHQGASLRSFSLMPRSQNPHPFGDYIHDRGGEYAQMPALQNRFARCSPGEDKNPSSPPAFMKPRMDGLRIFKSAHAKPE